MDENRNLPSSDKVGIPFLAPESGPKTDPSLRFGWGKFRPRSLQFLNSPKWFLACMVIYTICQGSVKTFCGVIGTFPNKIDNLTCVLIHANTTMCRLS